MDRLKGFTEEMRELGKMPSSRILERAVVQDRSISSIFGLPSTAPFLRLTRVRSGDGVPMSREVAWYNLRAVPALETGDLSGSVYAFLAEHAGAARALRADRRGDDAECGRMRDLRLRAAPPLPADQAPSFTATR